MHSHRLSVYLALALGCGCGESPAAETAGESSGGETSTTGESSSGESSGSESESETGEPPGYCGDGLVDPGEACDDANADDADGCTSACEIGPCGIEWFTRELVLTGSDFAYHTPLTVVGEDIVVAHQLGQGGAQTGLVWAKQQDGIVYAATELMFDAGPPQVHALIGSGDGDFFLSRSGAGELAEVHRVDEQGNLLWSVSRPSTHFIPDLQLSPSGELVLVNSVSVDAMNHDVELVALEPSDGSELWAHAFGGPVAPNGYTIDRGAALVLAADGRAFVAFDQYDAWDTLSPVVVAFGPDGDPTPLWTTKVDEEPGKQLELRDIALGPSGELAVSFMRNQGTQPFWLAELDAETGERQWLVTRDDFGLPNTLSVIRGLAVTDDRVVATGTWKLDIDGVEVFQAYVLGLSFTGELACLGSLDDYASGFTDDSFLPQELQAHDAGMLMAGYVYGLNNGQVDLLLARVR